MSRHYSMHRSLFRLRSSLTTTLEPTPSYARFAAPAYHPGQQPSTGLRRGFYASPSRDPNSFPAIFARGGTSNGLVIHRHHLPPQEEWETVLPAAMGSPDPYGRQLGGMGSGISSTSKICVLSPATRPDADVEFTFVQVGIRDGKLDLAGNCGNMSSVVGPVALDEGIVQTPIVESDLDIDPTGAYRNALVRIFNTNTSKIIHSRFRVEGNLPKYCPDGPYQMDGVPGTGSRITLSFLDPAGAKTGKALPTGNPVDDLVIRQPSSDDGDGGGEASVQASLVDVSNPGVFVRADDPGLAIGPDVSSLDPARVEADPRLKERLELVRRAGAAAMGIDPDTQTVPKIVLILPSSPRVDRGRDEEVADIRCVALSMGQAHKAVPLTLALCLGAAAGIPGTIPYRLRRKGVKEAGTVTIEHPSGRVDIGTRMRGKEMLSADLHRTARILMAGQVFY